MLNILIATLICATMVATVTVKKRSVSLLQSVEFELSNEAILSYETLRWLDRVFE